MSTLSILAAGNFSVGRNVRSTTPPFTTSLILVLTNAAPLPAFVRTKIKDVVNGGVVERTFRPTEKFPAARIDRVDMQYLYADGDLHNFMDTNTYEQIALSPEVIGDALKFVKENDILKVCSYNGKVFSVEPPLFVELEITDTEPGFKGDTAQGATKPATVETGAVVYVPLFVDQGDKIKIDTRTGEYLSRV